MKRLIFICIFSITAFLHAQDFSLENLQTLGDEDLLDLFIEVRGDSLIEERIARVYLDRARSEGDTIKMARGYDRLARIFHPRKNIIFADSVIELTKNMSNITYPGLGYMLKGYEYYKMGDLISSTKNDIIAYELALVNRNISQQLYLMNSLIASKLAWGNKNEALALQIKRDKLLNSDTIVQRIMKSTRQDARPNINEYVKEQQLVSIMSFANCYLKLGSYNEAMKYVEKGFQMSNNFNWKNNDFYKCWFLEASLETNYRLENFVEAINASNNIFRNCLGILGKDSEFNVLLHKGLSLIEIGEYELGVKYLKRSDSLFNVENISLEPDQRVLFEKLLDHSEITKDTQKQIEYLNKLIYVDSIFKINYQFFEPDLIRNFETPELLKEKEFLINGLRNKNKKSQTKLWWSVGILSISVLGLIYYFNRQLVYKRRFELLMKRGADSKDDGVKNQSGSMEISSEIIEHILSELDKFESNHAYLSSKVSLSELANNLGTNSRYLSKVINLQKDKGFPQYINDLRVDYAIKEMTENSKFRKYSIKAIAADCGFKSAESFSRSFYKRHGIYPSYYIKKIENLRG
jgi:AraC-like DNA-binding protein